MAFKNDSTIPDEKPMKGDFALFGRATIPVSHHWAMIGASLLIAYLVYKMLPDFNREGIIYLAYLSGLVFLVLRIFFVKILLKHSLDIDGSLFDSNSGYGKQRTYLNRGLRRMTPERKRHYVGASWHVYSERIRAWAFFYYALIAITAGTCFGLTANLLF